MYLDSNHFRSTQTGDVKNGTYYCYVRPVTLIVGGMLCSVNRRKTLQQTVRTYRQGTYNQSAGCLSGVWTLYIAFIRRGVCFKVRGDV